MESKQKVCPNVCEGNGRNGGKGTVQAKGKDEVPQKGWHKSSTLRHN